MDERVTRILDEAEAKLATLAGELVASRQYEEAKPVLRMTDQLRSLRETGGHQDSDSPKAERSRSSRPARLGSTSQVKPGYPKFAMEGDTLIKIGFSRRERAEYEHRSPLATLVAVSDAADAVADRRGCFTTDDLMPVADADGEALPSYQSYLCLAFLRDAGLVERIGRSQYNIARPGHLREDAEAAAGQIKRRPSR